MRKPALSPAPTPARTPARTPALRFALGITPLLLMLTAYALSAYADSSLLTSRST